ncbi:peptidase M1, membrane alanine aminopeptidase [Neoconidiobolus thromboides FSU 785]|nr:peptidase M1, membrane alanine aminopeptidase [Neoconidiobolus thromboides FSU 785]
MTQNPSLLPTAIKPIHYDLTILPKITSLTFDGLVYINLLVKKDTDSIVFNCKALDIKVAQVTKDKDNSEIEIAETIVNSEKQTCTLRLTSYLKKDEKWTLYIEFHGTINRGMAGFYGSSYNDLEGNEKMVVSTHFESSDARQAFPCWDEPALRATFDIKLIVEKDLIALANTPVESKNEIEINGERFDEYTFERTPNMSTYIVAFAIGDFDYVEGRTVEQDIVTRVYATRGSAHLGKFALDVAVRSMDLYYKLFDQPYPIKKLDLIAIPDFNIAAMENWGLITFRTVRLLNEDGISSLESTQSVADSVAHEVAHQWFGNLVALEWWSQLWLKEGFATYIASYAVDKLFPEWDTWTKFIIDN